MEKPLVSIIVPSREERFLNNTVNDILTNATGPIEVFVVLDGYEIPKSEIINDSRVTYLGLPYSDIMTKRVGINKAVELAKGEFVMSVDAHCCFAKGFDEVLSRDCEDKMIMIPRRYKLDAENWKINEKWPAIDYEYWMWDAMKIGHYFKNYTCNTKRMKRKHIMIDDNLTFQGSCWIMKKSWYKQMNFMRCEGYTPWGQEDVELGLETWLNGGRVVVNKNTWYAHLFKGKVYGRMYKSNYRQHTQSRRFAYRYWIDENIDRFEQVIGKFMPLPNWPADWKEQLKLEKGKQFTYMISNWG